MKLDGASDHSDEVSTHKLSNKKVYTERNDCSPTYILGEIKSNFITWPVLAPMISSVKS